MRDKIILFFAILLVLCGCQHTPEVELVVKECAAMPEGRASACCAVIGDKAYVFGGRDASGTYCNELWCYDATSDQWTKMDATPLKARVNAAMASDGNRLYVGLGYSAGHAYNDSAYQRDWWSYTPSDNSWKRLAQFPNTHTVAATAFAVEDKIYAIYGFGYGFTRDICRYEPESNTWETLPSSWQTHPQHCFGARGAWCNGLFYFGTGYDTHNLTDWWVSDVTSNEWRCCASVPGKGRELCGCTATDQYVYLTGGRCFGGDMTGGEVIESIMRYEPAKDQWQWCGTMPCGRAENQITFTIGGKAYFGLGENEKGELINRLYCIE